MNKEAEIIITDWFRRTRESQMTHYSCANHFSRLNYWIGIPTIVFSTAVGTAIFASFEEQAVSEYKVLLGLVSIFASVLAALQTFLNFSDRAEKHRLAGSGYASVRRDLELLKSFPENDQIKLEEKLKEIKLKMDHLAESSPRIPEKIFKNLTMKLKRSEHNRIFHLKPNNDKI